jgi:methylisocitrate lyase
VLFNVWDAGSAKAVARAGAKAIATSSLSVADANGSADGEHLPRTIAIENLRRIVAATDLPVTVDLESGYGETVGETVALAVDAGAAGCNLEDSIPGSGTLREIADQCERIRSARRRGLAFFINARTDVFFQQPAEQHNDEMLAEAVERAKAYAEAGADGIFAPGLGDIGLIARLARESPLPLNIMLGGNAPPLRVFTEVGVARISYGPQPYLIAMKALENAAREAVVETC